ncbi:MAG: hypothetical protein ACRDRK_15720 [Pseudonocardia sp.]
MRLRRVAVLAATGAFMVVTVTPAAAAGPPTVDPVNWSPELSTGEAVGITVEGSTARLTGPTGLLTLPARRLDVLTERVDTAVDGDLPAGTTAIVDVRGRRATGGWTEWQPATPGSAATLAEPTSEVQSRLVLTGSPGAEPVVRGLTLTARPVLRKRLAATESTVQVPLSFRVFATREGLVGGRTANGHIIGERDHFVALPSRRALAPRGSSDYSVKVCAANGRCAFAPVWDVGPWNTRDDYWNPPAIRQEWGVLPQGVPQAQAAYREGFNDGRDQYDRKVQNPAGIDLGDGLFWDALGLEDNSWVTVDYLWSGSIPLATVIGEDGPEDVLSAPDAAAAVVGVAARQAAVPTECVLGSGAEQWLKIGVDQFVPAPAVAEPLTVQPCPADPEPATAATPTDDPAAIPGADPADPAGITPADPAAADPAGITATDPPGVTATDPTRTGAVDTDDAASDTTAG